MTHGQKNIKLPSVCVCVFVSVSQSVIGCYNNHLHLL